MTALWKPQLTRRWCLGLSVSALLMLSFFTAWGIQAQGRIIQQTELDRLRNEQAIISIQQYTNTEHIRDIDRQLNAINDSHLVERMARLESVSDSNQKLLIGILGTLILLVVEAVIRGTGSMRKREG